jgi:hypothetical protein
MKPFPFPRLRALFLRLARARSGNLIAEAIGNLTTSPEGLALLDFSRAINHKIQRGIDP